MISRILYTLGGSSRLSSSFVLLGGSLASWFASGIVAKPPQGWRRMRCKIFITGTMVLWMLHATRGQNRLASSFVGLGDRVEAITRMRDRCSSTVTSAPNHHTADTSWDTKDTSC